MISAQSYNTDQAQGRYLYLGRGIATQFNDYVFGELEPVILPDGALEGLRITSYLGGLFQGEQVIDMNFIGSPLSQKNKDPDSELEPVPDFVLSGVVQESLRAILNGFTIREPNNMKKGWWIRGDLGLNVMRNIQNIVGNDQTRLVGVIELGFSSIFH